MSDVQAKLKVMPESPAVDFEALEEEIEAEMPETVTLIETDEEDIAFGLKALLIWVLVPDNEGGTELVENELEDLDDVESVRVEEMTRV